MLQHELEVHGLLLLLLLLALIQHGTLGGRIALDLPPTPLRLEQIVRVLSIVFQNKVQAIPLK